MTPTTKTTAGVRNSAASSRLPGVRALPARPFCVARGPGSSRPIELFRIDTNRRAARGVPEGGASPPCPFLTFDGSRRHPGDEVLHEERIEQGDRDRRQQRRGHELAPKEVITPDQLLDDA